MVQIAEPVSNWSDRLEASPVAMLRERIGWALGFLRRRYLEILPFVILSLGLGLCYFLITPSVYTASATMMIDTRKPHFVPQAVLADTSFDASWLDTQIGLIRSPNVALGVVKRLHLADNPKFAQYQSRLARILPASISQLLGLQSGQGPISEQGLAGQIAGGLDVKRVGSSYMLKIDFSSYDADQTVQIVNAVVDAYTTEQLSATDQANRRTSDWLQERFQTLREQAAAAERAVVDFKVKNNIVTSGGSGGSGVRSLADQQLADVSGQIAAARGHTEEIVARLARLEVVIHAVEAGSTANVTEELNNPIIQGLRSRYLEMHDREALWASRYGAQHQAVVNLRNQMADIQRNILNELRTIAETYKSEYEIAKTRQADLEKQWSLVVSQSEDPTQTTLHSLQSTADTYRTLYSDFLQKYMESVQQQSFSVDQARLVAPAGGAYRSQPKPFAVWTIVLIAGGVLGIAFGAFREVMDGGFRTSAQVRSILETDCLALVPLLTTDMPGELNESQSSESQTAVAAPRTICSSAKVVRALVDEPLSRYTEAFRSIKLALDMASEAKSAKFLGVSSARFAADFGMAAKPAVVLGLTSTVPEEGKSTIATGLAQLAALAGQSVILVDCDFRNPSLTRLLAPEASAGVLDVISGKSALEQAIWRDPATKLDFLPATGPSPLKNSSEVFATEAARRLFETLRLKYDYILVDLAPLVPIVDARAAAHLVDFYILVIQWGSTKVDMVQHVLNEAPRVHQSIIGAVLNKVEMNVIGKYERQNPQYQRDERYTRYGHQA